MLALDCGVTVHGCVSNLRRLAATPSATTLGRLLRKQLAEALKEHDGEAQGAAGHSDHAHSIGRASGARKSAP